MSLRHRDEHLAEVLGLRLSRGGEVDLGELGDAVDERGDLVAEEPARSRRGWRACPRRCRGAGRRRRSPRRAAARRGCRRTSSGWTRYGSPDLRFWPRVHLGREDVGALRASRGRRRGGSRGPCRARSVRFMRHASTTIRLTRARSARRTIADTSAIAAARSLVDDHVVVVARARPIRDKPAETARDGDASSVPRSPRDALRARARDGGNTEHAHGVGIDALELARALDVDVEEQVGSFGDGVIDRRARRAVAPAVHFRPFGEAPRAPARRANSASSMK